MATDFVVYYTTGFLGLFLVFFAFGGALLIWRSLLGARFSDLGSLPLVVAYGAAIAELAMLCFVSSYLDFSDRVSRGVFSEPQRWSVVPGRTLYLVLLTSWIVLPFLSLVAVPVAAIAIRRQCLHLATVGMVAFVFWITLSLGLFALAEKSEWERTHLAEAIVAVLKGFLPGILLVVVPFFLSLSIFARYRQQ
jgi:hypothetical protein